MSIYRDKASGRWRFDFDRHIGGQRLRRRQLLPAGWTRSQADAFDRKESAALYAVATGVARARHAIDEAVARYLTERAPQLKHGENVRRELAWLLDWYSGRAIEDLPAVCAEYAHDQAGALAPATIRNRIAYLRAACRWAWKRHGLVDHDPGARLSVPMVRNERHVYLGRAEMVRACRACTNWQAQIAIRVAFYTGMRLSELRRVEIDGDMLVLADTKNGDRRAVPAHPKIRHLLRHLPLVAPKTTIQRAWERARDATGLRDVHFHDLRHSAASEMVNAGVDLYVVGQVLGHRDPRSTQRYAHLSAGKLAEAVHRIGQKVPHAQASSGLTKASENVA